MSNDTQTIVQLTSLLAKAQMLLLDSYADKEYVLTNSLTKEKYLNPKPAGDEKTLLWLQGRVKKQMDQISELMCQIDKTISPPSCDVKEELQFSQKQRKAIDLVLTNEKVCDNLVKLSDRINGGN